MRKFILLLIILMLAACNTAPGGDVESAPAAADTATLQPTSPAPPTDTPTITPTATPEPTATATREPTATPLSKDLRDQLLRTYMTVLTFRWEVEQTYDLAVRIQSGELSGWDTLIPFWTIIAVAGAINEAVQEVDAPELAEAYWDQALSTHNQIVDILRRWTEDEIDSSIVSEEAEPLVEEIETTISKMERDMTIFWGVPAGDLAAAREEVEEMVNSIQATPTPVPEGQASLIVVVSHKAYEDGDRYTIIGEVQNTSDQPMEFVRIAATLYDDAEQVVGTDFTYTVLDVIPAGGKSPFEMSSDEWEGVAHYKLQAQGREGELPEPTLEILSSRDEQDGNRFTIIGEVRNTSDQAMGFVKVIATLYDEGDQIAGTMFTYTIMDVIPAGGKAPFEMSTDVWEGAARYELQVEGSPEELGRQDLEVASHRSVKEGSRLSIQGEVKNNGTKPAEYVKVIATLYDASNKVVGIIWTYTLIDVILPGESEPFESGAEYPADFDHYEIVVEGSEAE